VSWPGGPSQQALTGLAGATTIAARVADAGLWRAWLADPDTRARFGALTYWRGPEECAYWLGAISSTGHGKFRAGSRAQPRPGAPAPAPSGIVTAHVYAFQLAHGLIPARWAGRFAIRHTCDETSCQNQAHLLIGTPADNAADYQARRGRETGPLADTRGPRGRAVAIREAICTARREHADIEAAVARAIAAGIPPRQQRLF
jgi:hypothetical protein